MWVFLIGLAIINILVWVETILTRLKARWPSLILPIALAVLALAGTVLALMHTPMGQTHGGALAYNIVLLLIGLNMPTLFVSLARLRELDHQAAVRQAREDARIVDASLPAPTNEETAEGEGDSSTRFARSE